MSFKNNIDRLLIGDSSPYRIVSYRRIVSSYRIVVSYRRIVSLYRIVSYRIVSYRIVSYRFCFYPSNKEDSEKWFGTLIHN